MYDLVESAEPEMPGEEEHSMLDVGQCTIGVVTKEEVVKDPASSLAAYRAMDVDAIFILSRKVLARPHFFRMNKSPQLMWGQPPPL